MFHKWPQIDTAQHTLANYDCTMKQNTKKKLTIKSRLQKMIKLFLAHLPQMQELVNSQIIDFSTRDDRLLSHFTPHPQGEG